MKNIIISLFLEKKTTPISIAWFGFLRLVSLICFLFFIFLGVPYILGTIFYNEDSIQQTILQGLPILGLVITIPMTIIIFCYMVFSAIYSLGTKGIFNKENK